MSNIQIQQEQFSLTPKTFQEAMKYAELIANSDLAPKDYKGKPGNVMVALQMGAEVGLKPLQALQNIAVINGRPSIWGDAALAVVLAHPACEDVIEYEDENGKAWCIAKRKGREAVKRGFGEEDAKIAGLLGKSGPWTQYKSRMKQMRARGFALRDAFADVLKGLNIAEEVEDYRPEKDITPIRTANAMKDLGIAQPEPVIEHKPEPQEPIYDENGYTQEQLSALTDDLLNVIKNAKKLEDLAGIRDLSAPLKDAMRQTVVSACNAKKAKLKEAEALQAEPEMTPEAKEFFGDE